MNPSVGSVKSVFKGKWNAIVQLKSRHRQECLRFEGLAIIDAVQVAILEDDGAPAGAAESLFDVIRQRIDALVAGRAAPPYPCDGPQGLDCLARDEPSCRSVLVVVTGRQAIDPAVRDVVLRWNRAGPGEDIVLPVLPSGADPRAVLGHRIEHTNILVDVGHANSLADAVLQRAGFGGVERRLFISYRRRDCRALADQLFDAFSRSGFDVFLDRFSGTPGRLFPNELSEEIVDKGVVLLLESGELGQSPWTLAEAGLAFLFRIGLIAVNVDGAPPLHLIDPADRVDVTTDAAGEIPKPRVDDVISFVRRAYPRQMMQRRLYLEDLLRLGLRLEGLTPQAQGGGLFEVTGSGRNFCVGLSERAPGLADVRRAADRAPGLGAEAVVFGPHRFLAPDRRRDLGWLVDRLNVGLMAEGEVLSACRKLASGVLPR